VGADGAVALGHWQLTQTPKAGEGVFTLVLAKVDGRWGIVHDHTSLLVP
jgi:ketosteroid isomerase-like protein